jgi:hypothetical protein
VPSLHGAVAREGGPTIRLIIAGSRTITDRRLVDHAIVQALAPWGHRPIDAVCLGAARRVHQLGEPRDHLWSLEAGRPERLYGKHFIDLAARLWDDPHD